MAHLDLSTTTSSAAGLASRRTFTVQGGDPTTRIAFFSADAASQSSGVPLIDGRDAKRNTLVLRSGQSATFDDSSTYLGYTLTGTAPTAVWVDGAAPGNTSSATTGAAGNVLMSVAPAVATSPIAVGTNDARVCTVTVPVSLSGSDGSLAETIVWRAPYNCTIVGAFINSSVAMAASNTDYDTFTLQNRPLAGPGTPAVIVATTTRAADLNALAAWTEKSLGTLANTAMLAGDILAFKSAASGAGKASGPALLRVTYTVP